MAVLKKDDRETILTDDTLVTDSNDNAAVSTKVAAVRDVRMVLVNPSHPGNIGGAARAMKTMAVNQLVLVSPRNYPDPRAVWRAAGARDLLESAIIVETLDDALADCDLIVGTSARDRRIPWPLVDAHECAKKIYEEPQSSKIAILFGREDRGLKNEELNRCHLHVHVPTSDAYSSLNLAMAVQILSYELRMRSLQVDDSQPNPVVDTTDQWDEPFASGADVERFHEHLAQTLVDIDFFDPDQPKQLLTRLRRLFVRVRLDRMEINILRGILSTVQEKVKRNK
ncbi:MAG: RNA methyltransferase [Cellvibrionales bacterium]|jgi:tRNA (cytidine32/uridine32-2'-O)-methyltransferase|nr:RNA methyltransferase [Cellvibrionales bacterium]MBT5924084.1 RNA methyltransferase [Cellvibrionales bacterium]